MLANNSLDAAINDNEESLVKNIDNKSLLTSPILPKTDKILSLQENGVAQELNDKDLKSNKFFDIPQINYRLMIWSISILLMLTGGSMYSWSALECSLVNTLNISVNNAINISMWGNVGLCFALPAGFIYEYFTNKYNRKISIRITTMVPLITVSTGYLIMMLNVNGTIKMNWRFLAAIYCIVGQGSIFMYITAFKSTIDIFPKRFRGFVVGVIDCCFGISAAIWSSIADYFDTHISMFFMILCITTIIVNVCALIFVPCLLNKINVNDNVNINDEKEKNDAKDPKDPEVDGLTCGKLWVHLDFYLISIILFIGSGIGLLFMGNIDPMTSAFNLEKTNTTLQILIPLFSSISRIICGVLSDLFKKLSTRIILLSIIIVIMTIFQITFIYDMTSPITLYFGSCVTGFCFGGLMIITPLLVGELFGTKNMATNWGIIMFNEATAGIVFAEIQSIVVTQTPSNDICSNSNTQNNTCSMACFENGYIFSLISGFVAIFCVVVLYLRNKNK